MEGDLDTLTFGPLLLSPFHTVVTVDGGVANEARGFDGTVSWCYCVWRGFNSIGGRSLCYFSSHSIPFTVKLHYKFLETIQSLKLW
jgi:hypothetical protein